MDLDRFEAEFRKFKARVLPMVKEWEADKAAAEASPPKAPAPAETKDDGKPADPAASAPGFDPANPPTAGTT